MQLSGYGYNDAGKYGLLWLYVLYLFNMMCYLCTAHVCP